MPSLLVAEFVSFIRSSDEAVAFLKKIQLLLRHIGVSTANMEEVSIFKLMNHYWPEFSLSLFLFRCAGRAPL
jgi:hypothetical protein